MKLVINAGLLQEVVDAVYAVTPEARLRLGKLGVGISALDRPEANMVMLSLDPKAFETYETGEAELGVDLKKMESIISGAGRDDKVTLETIDKKIRVGYGRYSYQLSLLDTSSLRKEPKLPRLPLPVTVILAGSLLRDLVREAGKIGERVELYAADREFEVTVAGDLDSFHAVIPEQDLISIATGDGDASAKFSIDYLEAIAKVVSRSDHVTLNLGRAKPLKLSMSLAGGNGTVTYIVAPWIESK